MDTVNEIGRPILVKLLEAEKMSDIEFYDEDNSEPEIGFRGSSYYSRGQLRKLDNGIHPLDIINENPRQGG